MEALEMGMDIDTQSEDFAKARCSVNWCDARIFELQMARKMLDENDPRDAQINETIDLLFAEQARLLGVMNECNAASFGA